MDEESLPFEAHVERLPTWGVVAAALTVVFAALAAARLLPMPAVILPFVASGVARRFAVSPVDVEIDREGLWIGETLAAARSDVLDAWFVDDDREIRVTVAARPDRLLVVHLPNAEQARRFARALRPATSAHVVAGYRPRAIDALGPIRFVTVAVAMVANGGLLGGLLLLFVLPGALAFASGTQIDAGDRVFELRSFRGTRTIAYADVESVDRDACVVRLRDGSVIPLPPRRLRDTLLASPAWSKRALARVLAHVAARARDARAATRAGADDDHPTDSAPENDGGGAKARKTEEA